MVLVILGLAVLVIRPPVVMHYLNPILFWCYLGIILNVICVWVMLALVFHPDWMHRMVAAMIDLVTRIFHWKRGIKLRERLDGAMEKYSQAAACLLYTSRLEKKLDHMLEAYEEGALYMRTHWGTAGIVLVITLAPVSYTHLMYC